MYKTQFDAVSYIIVFCSTMLTNRNPNPNRNLNPNPYLIPDGIHHWGKIVGRSVNHCVSLIRCESTKGKKRVGGWSSRDANEGEYRWEGGRGREEPLFGNRGSELSLE